MRTRWIGMAALLVLALAGCGKKSDAPKAQGRDGSTVVKPGPDAAPPAPVPAPIGALAGKIPAVTGDPVLALGPPPAAVVIIDDQSAIRVAASDGSWAKLTAPDLSGSATAVASVDELPAALLAILSAAGGPAAEAARTFQEELAEAAQDAASDAGTGWGTVGTGTGWGGGSVEEIDVSITYAAEPGAEPAPATPLIVAHPTARAAVVGAVLDKVGGAFAVAHGTTVRVLRNEFPWENAGWGGAELEDEEAASIDVHLGSDVIFVGETLPLSTSPAIEPAGLTAALEAMNADLVVGSPIDVMITSDAQVQALVHALVALDVASERRLGAGVSPWPLPGFNSDRGSIGLGSTPRSVPRMIMAPIVVTGGIDKNVVRRYVRRNFPKLKYCYEKALLAEPLLAGDVTGSFTITAGGLVETPAFAGVSSEVSSCVALVIDGIELPKPTDGKPATAELTLTLEPTGG